MAIVGVRDFSGGKTLAERVSEGGPMLRSLSGWNNRYGWLTPDLLPTRVSDSALGGAIPAQVPFAYRTEDGVRLLCRDASEKLRMLDATTGDWLPAGNWLSCSFAAATDIVAVTAHGYADNEAIQFGTTGGGVTADVTYYVYAVGADSFKVRTVSGGAAIDLTAVSNTVSAMVGPVFDVISDSAPLRLDELVAFCTGGADAKVMTFEPDSLSTRIRPFSLRGPQWYIDKTKPTVTASSPARRATSIARFWTCGVAC